MKISWTPEQQEAINTIDKNLVVSASAGSGKTAVMLERILNILIKDKKSTLKRILLLSFNKSVAAELKEKVLFKLVDYASESNNICIDKIINEIDCIENARISTIDSFCYDLIKQYAQRIPGLTSNMDIIGDEEESKIKDEIFLRYLREFSREEEKKYKKIISYTNNQSELKEICFQIYDFLISLIDPDKWLKEYANKLYSEDNSIDKMFDDLLYHKVTLLYDIMEKEKNAILSYNGFDDKELKYLDGQGALPKNSEHKYVLVNYKAAKEEIDNYNNVDDIKPDNIDSYARQIIEFAYGFYLKLQDEKLKNGKLTFADLHIYVKKLLDDDLIKEEIQNSVDYVSVDEYQDINQIQNYIIETVSQKANLFRVGDVKQSIYVFRQARPEIFLKIINDAREKKSDTKLIYFNENFRSHPKILKFVNAIMNKNMIKTLSGFDYCKTDQFKIFDVINEDKCEKKLDEIIELSFSTKDLARSEEEMVASFIKSAYGNKKIYKIEKTVDSDGNIKYTYGQSKTVCYSDIVILCRTRNDIKNYMSVFEKYSIPYINKTGTVKNARNNKYIEYLNAILFAIKNHFDDYNLLRMMLSCIGNFSLKEINEINKKSDNKLPLYTRIKNYTEKFDGILSKKTLEFINTLNRYAEDAQDMKADEFIENLLDENINFAQIDLKTSSDGESEIIGLLSALRKSTINTNIYVYLENKEKLDLSNIDNVKSGQDSVSIQTMHSSKGLEWPIVVIANNTKSGGLNTGKILFRDNIGIIFKNISKKYTHVEQSRRYARFSKYFSLEEVESLKRLYYVALTRAKCSLVLVGKDNYFTKALANDKSSVQLQINPSNFLQMYNFAKIQDPSMSDFIKEYSQCINNEIRVERSEINFASFNKNEIKKALDNLNKQYESDATTLPVKFSVTELNQLIKVNKNNREKEKHDYSKSENKAAIGTLYHKIFENIVFDGQSADTDVVNDVKKLLAKNVITEDDLEKISYEKIKLAKKNQILHLSYDAEKVYKELSFEMFVPANTISSKYSSSEKVIVIGQVDMLIVGAKDQKTYLIDYKDTNESKEYIKKKYRLQLELYKKALELSGKFKIDKICIYVIPSGEIIEL